MSSSPIAPSQDFTSLVNTLRAQQAAGGLPAPGALPAAAAPAPTPAAPVMPASGVWQPGMSLNGGQQWAITQPGMTWAALAAMTVAPLVAPDPAIAATWDLALYPPGQTNGQPVQKEGMTQPNLAAAPIPTPSVGGINPTDAPPFQATQPSEMPARIETPFSQAQPTAAAVAPANGAINPAVFDGLDRDNLKALCESKGLCKSSCRIRSREPFIQALLTGVAIPEPSAAQTPPDLPAAPQNGFTQFMAQPAPAAPEPKPFEPPFGSLASNLGLGQELAQSAAAQAAPAPVQNGFADVSTVGRVPDLRPPAAPYQGGYTLFVYCMPVTNPAAAGVQRIVRLADILRDVSPQIEATVKAPHYAMVDFGKGRGLFAGLVQEWLAANKVGQGLGIVVDRTPEGADALSTLERFAGVVIRGL